eukprot:TRINITY_DN4773_c2_g1_i1.p1 TRINITY_DN4773_c2_g1~~TRINITY_DN4773_c2_g1_i1.p1  ORF type:complete len:539 (+),score=143.42 TRINITY_DN4773_c2_g1_i1:95-1711(+)
MFVVSLLFSWILPLVLLAWMTQTNNDSDDDQDDCRRTLAMRSSSVPVASPSSSSSSSLSSSSSSTSTSLLLSEVSSVMLPELVVSPPPTPVITSDHGDVGVVAVVVGSGYSSDVLRSSSSSSSSCSSSLSSSSSSPSPPMNKTSPQKCLVANKDFSVLYKEVPIGTSFAPSSSSSSSTSSSLSQPVSRATKTNNDNNKILKQTLSPPLTDQKRSPSPPSSTLSTSQHHRPNQSYYIDPSQLVVGDVVGRGYFGDVSRGSYLDTDVAIKSLSCSSGDRNGDNNTNVNSNNNISFSKEINILCSLRHRNVAMFMGVSTLQERSVMVMEWIEKGSLHDLIHNNHHLLTPRLRHQIALCVARGMHYIHEHGSIVHADLSSRNVLVDYECNENNTAIMGSMRDVKICDFGLSFIRPSINTTATNATSSSSSSCSTKSLHGCFSYMAPEVYTNGHVTPASDVYAYGVLLYELWSGRSSHDGLDHPSLFPQLACHGYRPTAPRITPSWNALINSCWNGDPKARPSFKDVIKTLVAIPPTESTTSA